MNGGKDGWMEGRMEGGSEGWMMSGWVDGQRGEWWMGGWVDGWTRSGVPHNTHILAPLRPCHGPRRLLIWVSLPHKTMYPLKAEPSLRLMISSSEFRAWCMLREYLSKKGLGKWKEKGGDQSSIITENTSEWTQWLLRLHEHRGWSFKDGVLKSTSTTLPKIHTVTSLKPGFTEHWLSLPQEKSVRGPELVSEQADTAQEEPETGSWSPWDTAPCPPLWTLSELVRWMKPDRAASTASLSVVAIYSVCSLSTVLHIAILSWLWDFQ